MDSFVTVYRSLDSLEAELLASAFEQDGIPVRHLGTRNAALIGAGQNIMEQRLEVDPAFETRARTLIREFLEARDLNPDNAGASGNSTREYDDVSHPPGQRNEAEKTDLGDGHLRGLSPMIALGAALVIPGGSHFYGRRPWAGWLVAAALLTLFVVLVTTDWGDHHVRIAAGMMLGGMWFADVIGGQIAVRAYNLGVSSEWWRQLLIPVAALVIGGPVAVWLAPQVPIAPPPDYGQSDVVIIHEPGYGDPFAMDPVGTGFDHETADPLALDSLVGFGPDPGAATVVDAPAIDGTPPDLVFDWHAALEEAPFDIEPGEWAVAGSHHIVVVGPNVHSRGATWWIQDDMHRRFATDNDFLVVRTDEATRIYSANGEVLQELDPGLYPVKAIPNGRFLAVQWTIVRVIDPATGQELVQLENSPEYADNLVPSGDGEWLAGLDAKRQLLLWDTDTGQLTPAMTDLEIREIRPAEDGFALRIGESWHHWAREDGRWIARNNMSPQSSTSRILSLDGTRMLIVDPSGAETVVDPLDGRVVRSLRPDSGTVFFTQRQFLSATRLAYQMSNGQVWIYDL